MNNLIIMNQIEILTLRKSLNWTQEDLAQHLGVEQATISRWENGATIKGPALRLIEILAQNAQSIKEEGHSA